MLGDGLKLMLIGMGAVFVFLTLMVAVISIAAKALAPFAHILEEPAQERAPRKKPAAKSDDNSLIAAIVGAVHMYRSEHEDVD